MHSAIKDIWRFSCNLKDDTDAQIMRVHTNQECLKIFSDAIQWKHKPLQIHTHGAKLTSPSPRKYSLDIFSLKKPQLHYFESKIREYVRKALQTDHDDVEIWVKIVHNHCNVKFVIITILL